MLACLQVGAGKLMSWFEGVRLACWIDPFLNYITPYITVSLVCTNDYDHPQLQRDQLSVLRSMRLRDPPCPVRVELCKWSMTQETIELLRDLPECADTLDFGAGVYECTWPLVACEYEQVAKCVPSCYTTWCLHWPEEYMSPQHAPLIKSMCAGIEQHRRGLRPVTIVLHGYKGEPVRMGGCVTLRAA